MRGPAQPCVAPSKAGKENKAKQLRKKNNNNKRKCGHTCVPTANIKAAKTARGEKKKKNMQRVDKVQTRSRA
jgi:hypothetical protein